MKLLKKFQDFEDAEKVAKKLEAKGILTFVSSKKSQALSKPFTGAIHVGLWIVLNNQYNDATSFLENKNHIIQTALSPEEIKSLREQTKESTFNSLNKFIIYSGVFIILFCCTIYLAFKYTYDI